MYRTSIPSDGSLCPVWRVDPLHFVFVCRAGSPETALNHSKSFADVLLVNARLWRELRDIKLRHSQVWNNSQQTCVIVIQRLTKTTKAAGSIPGSDWDRATSSNAPDPFWLCCSADLPDLLRLVTSRLWLTAADAEKGDPEADPAPIPPPPTGFLFPAGSNETYLKNGFGSKLF